VHAIFTKLYGCFYCLCSHFIIIYHIYFDQNIRTVQNFSLGSMGTVGKENGMAENDLGKKNARTNATKGLGVCLGQEGYYHLFRCPKQCKRRAGINKT